MDRNKKIILISAIILLVIIILVLVFFWFNKKPDETTQPPTDQTEIIPPGEGQVETLPPPSEARLKSETDYPLGLESLTSSFAERLASYSSDSNFKNFQDLNIISTAKMRAYLDNSRATSLVGQNGFEAQAAKVLNNQIIYLTEGKAVVVVSLQLVKYLGDQIEPTIGYAKLELTALKSGDVWLVDEIKWQ